jgi:UDP-2-acetamido-2,6-beta-L-arabino-hexul-4-ose reductase
MKTRVGITGAAGQLGFVTRARLAFHHDMQVTATTRASFGDPAALAAFVRECDAIVHLAGVNRASDEEIETGNRDLAQRLVDACARAGSAAHIVFATSIHRDSDGAYGRAKRAAGDILGAFCDAQGCRHTEIVLPNLFGEFSRPYYNNFVGTFCVQVARGEQPSIVEDRSIELLHYLDASDCIAEAIVRGACGEVRPRGTLTSVGAVAGQLKRFHAIYSSGDIPNLRDRFDLSLFNTYRSALFPDRGPVRLERRADPRGSFFECVRSDAGGQTSFSTSLPGVVRGNHFHFRKVERFVVLKGEALIGVRKLFSDHVRTHRASGDDPCFVDMPTLCTHNLRNIGDDELLTLFWTNDRFDPQDPDTYAEPV